MIMDLNPQEFALLSRFIEQQSGIMLKENKAYLIKNRLSHLVVQYGCHSFAEFYFRIRAEPVGSPMVSAVVDAITTGETSWFRDRHPFRILGERLFPQYRQEIKDGFRRCINILSLGCATGQEPYSIAMTALDSYGIPGGERDCLDQVKIVAVDICRSCLLAAVKGEYDPVAVGRGLSETHRDRYFRQLETGVWAVKEKVRHPVRFRSFNLGDKTWDLGSFDVIFLRNVIIYFSDGRKREIFEKVSGIMKPHGILFLGTGETVSGYTVRFNILEDASAIFYQLKP